MYILSFLPKGMGDFALGSFTSSRFILAHLAMLTSEHGAVDLSLLLSNGLMGLTQSVIRLAGKTSCTCSCVHDGISYDVIM